MLVAMNGKKYVEHACKQVVWRFLEWVSVYLFAGDSKFIRFSVENF